MRLWTTPSYTSGPARGARRRAGVRPADSGQAGKARQSGETWVARRAAAEAGRERAHLLQLQLTGHAVGVADRGEHKVGHGLRGLLRAGRVDGGSVDGEVHQLALPVDDGLH